MMFSAGYENWSYFRDKFGLSLGGGWLTKVEVHTKLPVFSYPFVIPERFDVAQTHSYEVPRTKECVVMRAQGDTNPTLIYYMEFPRAGIIQIGHNMSVTDLEWQFLVNVVHHLVQS
jgi:hypothetical protein